MLDRAYIIRNKSRGFALELFPFCSAVLPKYFENTVMSSKYVLEVFVKHYKTPFFLNNWTMQSVTYSLWN